MVTPKEAQLSLTEAIDYFRGKLNVTTERWNELRGQLHNLAFTMAGVTIAQMLDDIRRAVEQALSEGISYSEFRDQFEAIATRYGWNPEGGRNWRAQLVYKQNIFNSYGAGRYAQLNDPGLKQRRPYRQYRHGGSREPRQEHLALNGNVYRADDPWWEMWHPPNGFNCSCYVVSLSAKQMQRRGLKAKKGNLSLKPDPGFRQAPTITDQRSQVLAKELLAQIKDPALRGQAEQSIRRSKALYTPISEPPPLPDVQRGSQADSDVVD